MAKPQVSVRELKEDELHLVRQLLIEGLPEELDEFELKHMDEARRVMVQRTDAILARGGNEMYVATVEGGSEIAGYVWLGVSERPFSGVKVGWIYDLRVLPAHRGKGVGEALMRHALEAGRKRGYSQTGLMVRADNKAACSLYEKLGFKAERMLMTREETDTSASNS